MTFWAYMLHCRGGYFYVGHTDDLERRIAQHKHGEIAGFTADHRPAELVWSQDFQSRDEATASEKRIKGWSRAKKIALIRGDWARISALAKKKGSPSTSSGWVGEAEVSIPPALAELVGPKATEGQPLTFTLRPHPDTPPQAISSVTVEVRADDPNEVLLTFIVCNASSLKIPPLAPPARRDGLWMATCFEMFLKQPDMPDYWEFNVSPSGEWAAYVFSNYRAGMREFACDVRPHGAIETTGGRFTIDVDVDLGGIPLGPLALGLSAVIEETDGTKSYWALAHSPGKPDFHAEACFAATLAAPSVV